MGGDSMEGGRGDVECVRGGEGCGRGLWEC